MIDILLKLAGAAFLGSGAFAFLCLSVWLLERARAGKEPHPHG